ncbi:hypothetical protein SLE2022_363980 [Rubroshorea leprosula]
MVRLILFSALLSQTTTKMLPLKLWTLVLFNASESFKMSSYSPPSSTPPLSSLCLDSPLTKSTAVCSLFTSSSATAICKTALLHCKCPKLMQWKQ